MMGNYRSQAGQDKWVLNYMDAIGHDGTPFFLDVGAYDGVEYSNTYALEKEGWDGICLEPVKEYFEQLRANRECCTVCVAAGKKMDLLEMEVCGMSSSAKKGGWHIAAMDTLDNILDRYDAPSVIDYMSVDAEGMEPDVLEGFPFADRRCRLITIEHNLYLGDNTSKNKIRDILTSNGYVCVNDNAEHEGYKFEDWYIHEIEHGIFE